MNTLILYIIKSSICLMLGYIFYRVVLANEVNYKFNRWYLISILFISLLVPFNKFALNYSLLPQNSDNIISKTENILENVSSQSQLTFSKTEITSVNAAKWNIQISDVFIAIYIFVTSILLIRLLISVGYIIRVIYKGTIIKVEENIKIIYNDKINNSFTFFNFIVINPKHKSEKEINQIISHELLHAKQLHSLDLLFSGIMTVVFWFNPVVWMINRSLQQVHEYLADQNVLDNGTNIMEYQKMLLSIITEERLLGLSSSFNQSQIKKRLAMMTKKSTQQTKLKIIWAIPMIVLIFIVLSAFNPVKHKVAETKVFPSVKNDEISEKIEKPTGKFQTGFKGNENKKEQDSTVYLMDKITGEITRYITDETTGEMVKDTTYVNHKKPEHKPVYVSVPKKSLSQTNEKEENISAKNNDNIEQNQVIAVSPLKMNVLYVGVDNPVDIAISGVPSEEVDIQMENGTIIGENGHYIARPRRIGNCFLIIYNKDKEIGRKEFRVKPVPDPLAMVAGKKSGPISKKELLEQDQVEVVMENFDFDLQFKVIEFAISTIIEGFIN